MKLQHCFAVLTFVVFLPIAVRSASKWEADPIKFVLSFSSIWRTGRDFDFHLVLFENSHYTLPVAFVANLTIDGNSIASQTFKQMSYGYQKHTFTNTLQAKMPAQGDDYNYPQVQITFTTSGLKNYTGLSNYETKLTENFVFIQTDKAMYKPADNVKIRVLAINRDLKAVACPDVAVTVNDPNDHVIQEWTGQNLQNGLYSVNFSLSDFVALGDWSIEVKGTGLPETKKTFTVQQYVLPKYEVKLEFPNNYWLLSSNESNYKGYVRAKYTFGKTVRGKAVVVLKATGGCSYQYDGQSETGFYAYDEEYLQPPPKRDLKNITVNLLGDGSAEDGAFIFKGLNAILFLDNDSYVPTPLLSLQYEHDCYLAFDVNVTEELTGEEMQAKTGDNDLIIYQAPYAIKVHESVQKTLKPGLPFTMRFQVTKPDASPIAKRVDLLIQVYHSTKKPLFYWSGSSACTEMQQTDPVVIPKMPWHFLTTSKRPEKTAVQNFTATTDSDGLAAVTVTPPKDVVSTGFLATLLNVPGVKACEDRRPPSSAGSNSVSIAIDRQPSQSKTIPKVGDKMKFAITVSFRTPYVYFLLSQNGQVFSYSKLTQSTPADNNSTKFSVEITLPHEATPRAAALAWTVDSGSNEILADAVDFAVDGLVRQNVTASFTPGSVRPGDSASLKLKTTESNATVALLAVDKSVLLLKGGNDITLDDVLGNVGAGTPGSVSPVLLRCAGRCVSWWPSWIDASDTDSVFSGVGMVIKSNAITQFGEAPIIVDDVDYDMVNEADDAVLFRAIPPAQSAGNALPPASLPKEPGEPPDAKEQPPVVRSNFPESWIWEIVQTNSVGDFVKNYQAPDSITTWVLSALAIGSKNGFGALTSPAELTVFKDFFVNLDVSHPTIIRGEQVEIKAVIFNYQSIPFAVNALLKQSSDFEVSLDGGKTYVSRNITIPAQVAANSGTSVPIWIKPKKLGKINLELSGVAMNNSKSADAMRKEVLVEPEGEVRYANKPMLIRLLGTTRSIKQTINVDEMFGSAVPDVVSGSKMFQLQAIGDVMGPSLANLGSQIRLPTGCGEQTMITLGPNVYIYKYLKSAGLLTKELEQQAFGFVDQGYQHELTYQRSDGGISAFGNEDTASSTWLTAFVLRCFNAAKKYMDRQIDRNVLLKLASYLMQQAKPDGLFQDPGRVIHYSMQGGATSTVNLAAYVYTTWAEAGGLGDFKWQSLSATKNLIVQTGLNATNKDLYQLALTAYALSILPGDQPSSLTILNRLVQLATQKDGVMYWELLSPNRSDPYSDVSGPSQIETAAYALLAMINHGQTDTAISVARWLVSQRNSLGGFVSTQDTVVGLQALAEVAPWLSAANTAMNISANLVFDKGNLSTTFRIDSRNGRILQSFDPDRARQALKLVEISAAGSGVGLIQLAVKYNIQNQKLLDSGDFTLSVVRDVVVRRKRAAPITTPSGSDTNVQLNACTKPVTGRAKRGMVVLEVGIPTGFDLDLDATTAANKINDAYKAPLKLVESGDRKIVYYFDSLESNTTGQGACVVGKIKRTSAAANVQPPMARVYSYYAPDRSNATQFSFRGMSTSA